jgi:hypothetical protein
MNRIALVMVLAVGLLPVCSPSSMAASVMFHVDFESLSEVQAQGGTVDGSCSFIPGVSGNAVDLPETSDVRFFERNLSGQGTLEFWVRPGYEIKDMSRPAMVGLLELGDLSTANAFGLWAFRSDDGPVVIFEARDWSGDSKQAWSPLTSFDQDKWYHVAVVWNINSVNLKKTYAQVYVNGRSGKKRKSIGGNIDMAEKVIRVGTTGSYAGKSAAFDKLEIYDYIRKGGDIKRDFMAYSQRGIAATAPVQDP